MLRQESDPLISAEKRGKLADEHRRVLTDFLATGLLARLGRLGDENPLNPDDPPRRAGLHISNRDRSLYKALRARVAPPEGVNVCEDCWVVFESHRTRFKCDGCQRSPRPRPQLREHHLAAGVQQKFDSAGQPAGWAVHYVVSCQGQACETVFPSRDARTKYCRNCDDHGAGGQRRRRGSNSPLGRREFRYAAAGDEPLVSVSHLGESLQAKNGIVATRDEEMMRALDREVEQGALRRVA